MPRHPQPTTEQVVEMVSLYTGGLGCVVIGRRFGFSENQTRNIIARQGVVIRTKRKSPLSGPNASSNAARMIEMYRSGLGLREICKIMGAYSGTVGDLLRQHGITPLTGPQQQLARVDREGIIAASKAGASLQDITRQYHVSTVVVHRILDEAGLSRRYLKPAPAEEESIVEAYKRGVGYVALIKSTNRDYETVRRILLKHGVQSRVSLEGTTQGWGFVGTYKCHKFRSLMELSFILDHEEMHHIHPAECLLAIPYEYDGKRRRYHPDYLLNGCCLVEIKPPYLFNDPKTMAKSAAAKEYCTERGWTYVLTDWPVDKERVGALVLTGEVKITNRPIESVVAYLDLPIAPIL